MIAYFDNMTTTTTTNTQSQVLLKSMGVEIPSGDGQLSSLTIDFHHSTKMAPPFEHQPHHK